MKAKDSLKRERKQKGKKKHKTSTIKYDGKKYPECL